MDRRTFIHTALTAALAGSLCAAEKRRPRIVLRSSWQTVNIGDIGHTPGVLALLEKYLPEAEVRLWPSKVDNGVDEMLRRRFPKVPIIEGADAIKTAFEECDFMLHGSGPSLVAAKDLARWRKETGKPFGIYGITVGTLGTGTVELMSAAKFAFFRDSVSLAVAKESGVRCPVMEFGPDGAFAVDLRNDAAAAAFLQANGLEEGKFLCCLSRLRHTPYWKVKSNKKFDESKHARNEAMKEHDHAPLREAIVAVVRQTPLKVLLCPEDATQMAVGREMLYDRLPDDVKARVVWRERYWLTDEAVSTYIRSAGLFGSEMHSPIMALGNGVPAIVCRFAEQTSKGIMWRDIGLGDWLFDFDNEADIKRVVPTVLAMAKDPGASKAKAAEAREFVQQRQRETMDILRKNLGDA
ncbi:MAG TPA: polysaccharide pyruvyl transferase family protein [Verrucomicrobiae bacterium]|nr:polysaccharide pyruvyl transferase family protein [Verrucomicrobiae bacterium]